LRGKDVDFIFVVRFRPKIPGGWKFSSVCIRQQMAVTWLSMNNSLRLAVDHFVIYNFSMRHITALRRVMKNRHSGVP